MPSVWQKRSDWDYFYNMLAFLTYNRNVHVYRLFSFSSTGLKIWRLFGAASDSQTVTERTLRVISNFPSSKNNGVEQRFNLFTPRLQFFSKNAIKKEVVELFLFWLSVAAEDCLCYEILFRIKLAVNRCFAYQFLSVDTKLPLKCSTEQKTLSYWIVSRKSQNWAGTTFRRKALNDWLI